MNTSHPQLKLELKSSCYWNKFKEYLWTYYSIMWTNLIFYGVNRCLDILVTCLFVSTQTIAHFQDFLYKYSN